MSNLGVFVHVPDLRRKIFELAIYRGIFRRVIGITVQRGSLQGDADSQLHHNREGQATREWWDMEA